MQLYFHAWFLRIWPCMTIRVSTLYMINLFCTKACKLALMHTLIYLLSNLPSSMILCMCCTLYLQRFIHQGVLASFITAHPVNQIAGLRCLSQRQTLKVCSAECLAYQSAALLNTRKQDTDKGRNGRRDFQGNHRWDRESRKESR